MKGQRDVVQRADIVDPAVDDLQLPVALRPLSPEVGGHEGPVEVGGGVIEAGAGQAHLHAAGGGEAPFQIARVSVRGFHFHGHVLEPQIVHRRDGESAEGAIFIGVRDRQGQPGLGQLDFLQRGNGCPRRGHGGSGLRVHQPGSVALVEVEAAAVRDPAAVELVVLHRRAHQDLLHVAIGQVRVGLQHQGHDAGDGWRGR